MVPAGLCLENVTKKKRGAKKPESRIVELEQNRGSGQDKLTFSETFGSQNDPHCWRGPNGGERRKP